MGAGWPYQTLQLQGDKQPVKEIVPLPTTGWADTWMLAAKAPHPNCAYKWMQYVTTPKVEAQQAIVFGETPVNPLACPYMDKIQKGSCAAYHLNEPRPTTSKIKFWKTPVPQCGWNDEQRLHGLQRLGTGVDADNAGDAWRLTPAQSRRARRSGGPASASRGFFWRRPWLRAARAARPAARGVRDRLPRRRSAVLFISSLWTVELLHVHDRAHAGRSPNYRTIFEHGPAVSPHRRAHVGIAAAVTLTYAVLAFPLAYFMARLAAQAHARPLLFVMVLLPLWSSYLVRIYAWQTILAHDGAINWALNKLGLPDQNLAYTNTAMWIVFTYVWLPFMVLPVYAALERIPDSYLEASRRSRRERLADVPLA